MKKIMFLMLAVATVLFTQCKKTEVIPQTKFKTFLNKGSEYSIRSVVPTTDGYVVGLNFWDGTQSKIEYTFLDKEGIAKSNSSIYTGRSSNTGALIVAQNGDCIGVGSTALVSSNGIIEYQPLVVRTDSKGVPLWIKKAPTTIPLP